MFFFYFLEIFRKQEIFAQIFRLEHISCLGESHTYKHHVIKSEWTKNSRETFNMPISLTVQFFFSFHFCDYCNSNNKKMYFYSNLSMIRIIISTKHDEYEQNRLLCRLNTHIVGYVFFSFLLALWNIFSPTLSLSLLCACACVCVFFLLLRKALDQEHR